MEHAGAIRRLRVAGAIAILTIALLTIASAAFLAWRHYTAPQRTELINRSGLRRGQSVMVLYRAERLGRLPHEVPELDAAIRTLERSQAALMDLTPEDQTFFATFVADAKEVAAHPRDAARRDALESVGARMYRVFYDRTVAYSEHASANSEWSFRTTMLGSAVTLLVLGLLYAFVVRPGERFVATSVRELEQSDERMRSLYRIASAPDAAAGSQIDEALALGAAALQMEYGFVSQIVDGVATIRHRVAPDALLPVGASFGSFSIGAALLASPRAIAFDDLTVEPYASEMRERRVAWQSAIGARVVVGNTPYGALAFLSNRARTPGFDRADRDFIDLMSALIGSALARMRLQAELRDMAFHDTLTGLANRALLEEHVGRAFAQAQRTHDLVAIHYLDLDNFKPINDELGHAVGDLVLCEAARRFLAVVRANDVVARIGGDEFVVLQTGASDEEQIRQLAQRLRNIANAAFALPSGEKVFVGVSVGTAIYPRDAADAAGLLRAADGAMYGDKATRRKAG